MIALALLACGSPKDSGPVAETARTEPTTPGPTTTPPPTDVDGDGFPEGTDCDDYAPDVFPGATEQWNQVDDDCDGRVDADGAFAGAGIALASTVYEGTPYQWTLDCSATLDRIGDARVDFVVTCPTDPGDALAVQLLGVAVVLTPIDTAAVDAAAWGGAVTYTSDAWAADGAATATWSGFDQLTLSSSLSTTWLDVSVSAAMDWTGPTK